MGREERKDGERRNDGERREEEWKEIKLRIERRRWRDEEEGWIEERGRMVRDERKDKKKKSEGKEKRKRRGEVNIVTGHRCLFRACQ